MTVLPPIDAHAHVQTSVSKSDMRSLQSFVFAVTRGPDEWAKAQARSDDLAIWGIGAHPGVSAAIERFDRREFARSLEQVHLVGEVGLDARSNTPLDDQRKVFASVLEVTGSLPRPVSIHSAGAAAEVLDVIEDHPVAAPILHWWRGNEEQTERALEMGCFFSVNGAEVKRPKVLGLVPHDRLLTETDFPHTKRSDRSATRPAAVDTIENELVERWNVDLSTLRLRLWRTVGSIFDRCDTIDSLPTRVQEHVLTAGFD